MTLHLGVRHWDHVVPLALGDVGADLVKIDRLDATPDLWRDSGFDGGETSFSRYVRARAAGNDHIVALPVFLMRGFRHRCIIVRSDSGAKDAAALRGARIGLTGWADSGNVWTRAILREAGIGVDDADWQVGPLTSSHPVVDRIGNVAVGDNVRHTINGAPLVDLLRAGELDAVMTPFMPPGFHTADSDLRTLYPDNRQAEADYYGRHRYIPGIHVLTVRSEVLRGNPAAAQQLVTAFEAAKRLSRARRDKLVDVTPWHNEEVAFASRVIGSDWLPYGLSADRVMVRDFQTELVEQRLLAGPVPEQDLFPYPVEPNTAEEIAS